MQRYIDVSMLITDIYKSYTDLVEPYSIDEQFLDVTGSMHLFADTPKEMARIIQAHVQARQAFILASGLPKPKSLQRLHVTITPKESIRHIYPHQRDAETLWKRPVSDMFMAGSRMTRHFNAMGLLNIGSVAQTPLVKLKQMMRRKFGKNSDIQAEMYWRIANGIDDSPVRSGTHQVAPKSVGHMMTLPFDYREFDHILTPLLELTELVCQPPGTRVHGACCVGGVYGS